MANKVELADSTGASLSSTNPLYTHNPAFTSSATFTPTAAEYTAGDVWGVAQQFASIGPAEGGTVRIVSTSLQINHTALVASEGAYTLYLYNATPPSAPADNAAWSFADADRASWLGYLTLGTPVDLGNTLWVETNNINKMIRVPVGGSVFGLLVNAATITPTAAARIVTIHAIPV